ncbi:hypothetical protein E2562_037849, partial [Oryza meyeriana var. granulata]
EDEELVRPVKHCKTIGDAHSEAMESNAIDGEASLGPKHTLGGNVLQTGSQEQNVSQTQEDNDATHHIIQQTGHPTPTLGDNGAAENNDEKQADEAKQSKNVLGKLLVDGIMVLKPFPCHLVGWSVAGCQVAASFSMDNDIGDGGATAAAGEAQFRQ